MKNIYIFGAHSRAQTVKEYISVVYPDMKVEAYLVDNDELNADQIDGIPVIHLDQESVITQDLSIENTVYLGVKKNSHEAAKSHLEKLGFHDIIPMTVELDNKLRNLYLEKYFAEKDIPFRKIYDFSAGQEEDSANERANEIGLYVASSAFDGKLEESHVYENYEKVIQVGCALTDIRLDNAVVDNIGENISDRNKQFCELTATYWIWKNAKEEYVGLEHYRRFFILPNKLYSLLKTNEIDVILPVPLFVAPNIADNYKFRHDANIWDDMMAVLEQKYPEDYPRVCEYFAQGVFCPCNMVIAKKDVFDRMCEWLFSILLTVHEKNQTLEDRYQNRYPGFLAERLMSAYFFIHRNEFNTIFADKVFLS